MHDITLGEQDPGKDLFAILFLLLFVILLVQIVLISKQGDKVKAPGAVESAKGEFIGDEKVAFITKKDGTVVFRVGGKEYSKKDFFQALPSLPVVETKEDGKYVNLQTDNSIGGLEWDFLKLEIKERNYNINVTVPAR